MRTFALALLARDPMALLIVGVAVAFVAAVIIAIKRAHGLSYEDREAERRIAYRHQLRKSRPVIVYERRIPSSFDAAVRAAGRRGLP